MILGDRWNCAPRVSVCGSGALPIDSHLLGSMPIRAS